MKNLVRLLSVASAAVLASCGGPTLKSICQDSARVSCDKLFECSPQAAASLGYTSAADCVTKRSAQVSCEQFDTVQCTGLDLSGYQRCLDETRALACTATTQPASCTGLGSLDLDRCTSSDGKVVCTQGSSTGSNNGCTSTYSSCGDGKTYSVSCSGGSCTCTVDGQAGATFQGSDCDKTAANTACRWNLR